MIHFAIFKESWHLEKKMDEIMLKPSSLYIDLDKEDQEKVRQVYLSLSTQEILDKCLQGLTQNANESFHSKMWKRASKKILREKE